MDTYNYAYGHMYNVLVVTLLNDYTIAHQSCMALQST